MSTTESVRNTFIQYGFMPARGFKYTSEWRNYRVFDEVQNKYINMKYRNLMNGIRSGWFQPVDPFLHWLNYSEPQGPAQSGPAMGPRSQKLASYTQHFPMDKFRNETTALRSKTMMNANTYKAAVRNRQPRNVVIERSEDDDDNKANLYALIDTLYAVANEIYPSHRVSLEVIYRPNDIRDYLFPTYFHINDETIAKLTNLINHLWYGEELKIIDTSDSYTLASLAEWQKMSIIFEEDERLKQNRLEQPAIEKGRRRNGAKWAWLNMTPIDLTRYGIFNKFDENNYTYPCFVWALEKSGKLTVAEIEDLKSIINTKRFPTDNLKYIAERYNITIVEYFYDENKKQVYKDKSVGSGDRTVELLLRYNHYMIFDTCDRTLPISKQYIQNYKYFDENTKPEAYHKRFQAEKLSSQGTPTIGRKNKQGVFVPNTITLNELINIFFECDYFEPLTNQQLVQTIFQPRTINYENLEYPESCVRPVPYTPPPVINKKVIYTSEIDKIVSNTPDIFVQRYQGTIRSAETVDTIYKNNNVFFTFDPTDSEIDEFKQIMESRFCINIDDFNSTAAIGQELMHKYGCFKDVYQLSGKPALFISKCAPKITVAPAFGQKQNVSGDLVSIDKNGSYTSIYRDFDGIPRGKPKIIESFKLDNDYSQYYLHLDIKFMRCKHSEERFPTEIEFVNKTMLMNLLKHYDMEFDVLSGYYFDEGFNENIKRLAIDLYNIREEYKAKGSRIESIFKGILCTLWGKCAYKQKKFETKCKSLADKKRFMDKHEAFLYNSRQINDNTVSFTLSKPLALEYAVPQFSTDILSYSKAFMNDLYFKAADMHAPIYYSNTDCMLMDRENAYKLGVIGDKLGEFKIEYDNISRAMIISAKKFLWVYKSGDIRCVSRKRFETDEENVAYFERFFRK